MTIRRSATQTRSAGVAAGEFRCNIMLVRLRSGVRILCAWESYCMIPLPRTRRCCWTLHTHVVCEIVRAEAVFGIVHTSTTMGCSLLLSNRFGTAAWAMCVLAFIRVVRRISVKVLFGLIESRAEPC